jgi:O-antigen/teichoic acid export membrane protein
LFNNYEYVNVIRIFGCTVLFYSLNSLVISVLNGRKEIRKYTAVNLITSVVGLVLTLFLVYYFGIKGALYALVLSQSLVFFISISMVIKAKWLKWEYFKEKLSVKYAKLLSHYSLMAIVSSLTVPVAQIIIRNLLIDSHGINAAGTWQGMIRISDGYLYVVTTSISTYYLPKLASLQLVSDIRKEIYKGFKFFMPIVFASCIIVYLLRFFIIRTLYTVDFLPMDTLFLPQLAGDIFKIASWILSYLMLAKAMTKTFIATEIIFSTLYVSMAIYAVNIWGVKGASIAFAVNYFLYLVVMILIFKKVLIKPTTKIFD